MSNGQPYLGVTPPISHAPPNALDLELTKSLKEELERRNQFETREEEALRVRILGQLNALVKRFVYEACLDHGLPPTTAREAGGKICTFGSYRLGVHGPGADIDTLCVVPRNIDRNDFFGKFADMLAKREEVTEVTPVPQAFVPVIKIKFSGISMDLLCAQLTLASVPESLDVTDDNLLRGLDEASIRSLNGSRNTDEILKLVPNIVEFRLALRAIKLWGKRRAISSNIIGFLGGISWAILTARMCQLYPNASASAIVTRFFSLLRQWNWPKPIMLKNIDPEGQMKLKVWNPQHYPSDRQHRMPIITPAFPAVCTTHNVTASTMTIFQEELNRGFEIITNEIETKQKGWDALFEADNFFQRYKWYLQVYAWALDSEVQRKWSGTVESRLRRLVGDLDYTSDIDLAHPYVKQYDLQIKDLAPEEFTSLLSDNVSKATLKRATVLTGESAPVAAANGAVEEGGEKKVDSTDTEVPNSAFITVFYIGLKINQAVLSESRSLNISDPIFSFREQVRGWDAFEVDKMGLFINTAKCSSLPDYVYEPGQKPVTVKTGKRKRVKQDVDPDETATPPPAFRKLRASSSVPQQNAATPPPSTGRTDTSDVVVPKMPVATNGQAPSVSA